MCGSYVDDVENVASMEVEEAGSPEWGSTEEFDVQMHTRTVGGRGEVTSSEAPF